MSDHFKEPLQKIDTLIEKLEANVGVAHEGAACHENKAHHHEEQKPSAMKCTLQPPAEHTAEVPKEPVAKEPVAIKCAIFGPAPVATEKSTEAHQEAPKVATEAKVTEHPKTEKKEEKKDKPKAEKKEKAPEGEKK